MTKRAVQEYRRSEARDPVPRPAFGARWYGKVALLGLTVLLLTGSFAPMYQFYLAWFALAPWMVVVRHCRSTGRAFLWSWAVGIAFFGANMWWLWFVTGPGMVALIVYLALYFGFAAV
ncbi:MAG: hypothetical protein ACREIT_05340, partial [Tepidisphaeraceae bacterium]